MTSTSLSPPSDDGDDRDGGDADAYRLASSESALFAEADEALDLIAALASDDADADDVSSSSTSSTSSTAVVGGGGKESSPIDPEQALASLRSLLDRYLECPTLLDPHLEGMCSAIMGHGRTIVHADYVEWRRRGDDDDGDDDHEGDEDGANVKETSNDPAAAAGRREQGRRRRLSRILSAVYALSKVRGRKHVGRFLPHGVDDVEPVLHSLRTLSSSSSAAAAANEETGTTCEGGAVAWESSYSLLLWLGTLSLVPFGLDVIDSSAGGSSPSAEDTRTDNVPTTLAASILHTARLHLGDPGPTRDAAASCLSSLLSRPDLETGHLEGFVAWSDNVMGRYLRYLRDETVATAESGAGGGAGAGAGGGDGGGGRDDAGCVFLAMGAVQTLAGIFKTGNRSNLVEGRLRCVERVWARAIAVAETAAPPSRKMRRRRRDESNKGGRGSSKASGGGGGGSIQLRKLLTKLFARVGAAYLPPRVAPWRYQRGRRSLMDNLSSTTTTKQKEDGSSNATDNKNGSAPVKEKVHDLDSSSEKEGKDDEDELFHVPDPVEDATSQILLSLTDPATVVRWSAAKGLGRIVARLPRVCADDVLDALIGDGGDDDDAVGIDHDGIGGSSELAVRGLFADDERDAAWHGGCLALAELARRGLLLPARLADATTVVARAMRYDVRRGRASVGSHVRDAACYAVWAFARAYAPGVLKPHVPRLSRGVVLCALFDREVNCRRAAGAAFQECVGRQGADNFKHGIDILTLANYYSLGNRTEAYTSVAYRVAAFDEYRRPIIDRVTEERLGHWDGEIRILASKAVGRLTELDGGYVEKEVLPKLARRCVDVGADPAARHGAVLGAAEAVLALGQRRREDGGHVALDKDAASTLAELVPAIEKARLYRGRCGEEMRAAVGRFIECLALAEIPLTVKQQVRLLDSVDDCLKHPKDDVQNAAASALHALLRSYFPVGPAGPSPRLQKRVVDKYIDICRTEDNPAATRGYALALGRLPRKLLAPNEGVLESVLGCLYDAARVDRKVGDEGDAETRRNAVLSLAAVCEEVGIVAVGAYEKSVGFSTNAVVGLSKENVAAAFDALLASLDDYNSDRRGDVGSWSRIAAMRGLVSLTRIAVRASVSVPHLKMSPPDNPATIGSAVPSLAGRTTFLEPDAYNRVGLSVMRGELFRRSSEVDTAAWHNAAPHAAAHAGAIFFDEPTCARVIGALLKQLSEKLDAVRQVAGTCLEELLLSGQNDDRSESVRVPFVPNRRLLLEALNLRHHHSGGGSGRNQQHAIDWANPASTFPLVMRAVNIDEFFEDVVSGMVISVGGLTKSVTAHSTAALLEWTRGLIKGSVGANKVLAKLGNVFLKLFDRHRRDGRVVNPLLKTIDALLTHGCLDTIFLDEQCGFAVGLLSKLRVEARGCSDVKRLFAIGTVLVGSLREEQRKLVTEPTLHFLMLLLGHRYPRVRRATAEQLYVKLLEDGTAFSTDEPHVVDEVNKLLLEVAWDGELDPPGGNVRECRNRVADLLGVELSSREREKTVEARKKGAGAVATDTFQSYATLVNDSGR